MSDTLEAGGRENPLDLWMGLEIRRARATFDEVRASEDAVIVAKVGEKTGIRVKAILKLTDQIITALATATLDNAKKYQSSDLSRTRALDRISSFLNELSNHAIWMAHFVKAGPSGLSSVTSWISALQGDIEDAFLQASMLSVTARAELMMTSSDDQERTGDPGRPEKGTVLYVAEFNRRIAGGLAEVKLADEAQALFDWFKATHPGRSAPTPTTIENRIRTAHRQYRERLAR